MLIPVLLQMSIEGIEALERWNGHQEVPADIADQTFYFALVVPFAWSVRATVFSMRGQGDALGQIVFGPAMGALATIATIRVALTGVAALLFVPTPLFIFSARHKGVKSARA